MIEELGGGSARHLEVSGIRADFFILILNSATDVNYVAAAGKFKHTGEKELWFADRVLGIRNNDPGIRN
jgi:hypothetical protein